MNIKTIENRIRYGGRNIVSILGPTFAKCSDGSMIMTASVSNGSDSGVGNMQWRSNDEGEHWTEEGFIERSFQCDHLGSMKKVGGNAALYTDDKAGVILFTSNEGYWNRNNFESTKRCYRPFYRLSFDNGHTWTDKIYIITEGHTLENPIKDVVYGRNFTLSMASQTLRADDGALLVALQTQMTDESGNLIEPSGFHFFECGALRAAWNADTLSYSWTFGDYVSVTPRESMRGVFEPTFGRLKDNTFVMVMRNSNHGDESVVGQKFYSVSSDNGQTWSRPKPLTYDDGSTMYSCSSSPKLFAHSNGKLYYVGIINDKNPSGNSPRYPLAIAELDRNGCTIIKDSVTLIDTARQHHYNAEKGIYTTDYSNHGIYEDSKHRLIVYAPYRDENGCSLNRYEITI